MHWIYWICRVVEAIRIPKLFDLLRGHILFGFFWHILTRVSPLNDAEIKAASEVFGSTAIRYDSANVAEGGLLSLIFRINGNIAFTTFHTINLPKSGIHSRKYLGNAVEKPRLDLIVHELTHVYQFERVGSIYICQALRAQREKNRKKYFGYNFGGYEGLKEYREKGWHLRQYNREQQAMIAQKYYSEVVAKEPLVENDVREAYKPFIKELRNGKL